MTTGREHGAATPPPPWVAFPWIQRYSIGWRMGSGEDYIHAWHEWADAQTHDQLLEYFERHRPPLEWADFVADRLYPELAATDIAAAVARLAERHGWVDPEAWRSWSGG